MLVAQTRLNVSELEYFVTWSQTTGVDFPFLKGKRIQYNKKSFCLTTPWLNHFYLCKLHLKNEKFLFAYKHFLRKLKDFCLSNLLFDEKSGTSWGLMDNERNTFVLSQICIFKEYCYQAATAIKHAKLKMILN